MIGRSCENTAMSANTTSRKMALATVSLMVAAACTESATLTTPARSPLHPSFTNAAVPGLVEISRPNAVGSCNTGVDPFGVWSNDYAEEPVVAADPTHSNAVVAAWIQGPFQEVIAAVSSNGGQSWQQVSLPLTICTGGPYTVVGDPWLSFAPNGDLYTIALAENPQAAVATNPASWGNEVRLTAASFNMEAVGPALGGALFLGDYFGLVTAGNAFVSTFTAVDSQNLTGIFARRIGQ